jgi:peroxiredoxin
MKKIRTALVTAGLALGAILALWAAPAVATGAVGEKAPTFKLTDLNGKAHALDQYQGKVVVLEWINPNCPFSDRQAREKTMVDLNKKYGQVVWLGINSTNPKHQDYLPPAEHLAWAKKNGIGYSILYDPTGSVGHAYGAKTTPHMFIVDASGKIAYNGAIDDDPSGRKAKPARVNYVDSGLAAELAGRAVAPAVTQPYGCSVKY